MGRGSNWTSTDNVAICQSWLHVSGDSTVGNHQKFSTFWDKIMAEFKTKLTVGEELRTVRACQSRWSLINRSVTKFVGAHAKAVRSAPSGTNNVDMERRAMEIYRMEHIASKAFDFRECWMVLNSNPKWQSGVAAQFGDQGDLPRTDDISSSGTVLPTTPSAGNSATPITSRLVGAKRAKADIHQGKVNDRALKAIELADSKATKRRKIMQDQVALGYMRIQLDDVVPELRALFLRRRARLLKGIEEEERPASPTANVASPAEDEVIPKEPAAGQDGGDISQEAEDDDILCFGAQNPSLDISPNTCQDFELDEDLTETQARRRTMFSQLQDFF